MRKYGDIVISNTRQATALLCYIQKLVLSLLLRQPHSLPCCQQRQFQSIISWQSVIQLSSIRILLSTVSFQEGDRNISIMSKPTPRKSRHNRHPSNRIPAISDYESDAAITTSRYEAPPPRTNTELNLSVLQRYLPSISRILSIAANAVVYTFDNASQGWEKSGIEGTMFVCAQTPLPEDPDHRPRACVFVLSRRGLDNVIVDLARVGHVEIAGELVILKVEGHREEGEKVVGLWIHNDEEGTRATNGAIIEESWKIARAAGTVSNEGPRPEAGPAMQAIGRPLTLNELFGRQQAAGGS